MSIDAISMNSSSVKETKIKMIQDRRRLKHSGKPYSTSTGKPVEGKQLPSEKITCKCRYDCKTLSKEHRHELFTEFYKISVEDQGTYLLSRMQVVDINRRRHGKYENPSESRRQNTVFYTVPNGKGEHVKVCSNTFKNIFGISPRRLHTLQNLKKQGKLLYEDGRGKAPGCNAHKKKFTENDRNLVQCHILSNVCEIREKLKEGCLNSDLSYSQLYKTFTMVHPQSNVTRSYYVSVFKKDFPQLKLTHTRSNCDKLTASVTISASPAEKQKDDTQLAS